MTQERPVRTFAARLRSSIEGPDGPPLAWTLRGYGPDRLQGDIVSGLTVAALIVPLVIGYAAVAGLPPENGLYASMVPLIAYAVFGSGRRLIVGPDASSAALIGATLAPLAIASDDRVRLAGVLALMVAGIFVAMRLGRMGFLADFLSRPILVGYLTGVGITVAVGQVAKIMGGPAIEEGLGVVRHVDWAETDIAAVLRALELAIQGSGADRISAAIGIVVVVALLLGRRFVPRLPMALLAMIAAMAVSAILDLQALGVAVLGPVPSGLPRLGIPVASPVELVGLLPGALGLAVLTFADTAATGRSFARRNGERVDANRELVALAAADAGGALTGGYPVSSSPSRTSAAEEAGSSSQMTGLVAFGAVAVVLVLLTGPLSYLPIPALGAVILVSVMGLIDVRGIQSIARLKASEGLIALITMTGVILYGTLLGVALAVLLAALNIVRRAAWPHITEEGRLPNGTWRDLARVPGARRVPGVVVVRFIGPLFFANAAALDVHVRELVAARPATRCVVIDLGPVADIDVTAGESIRQLADELARNGRRLAVARPLGLVRDELRAYGLVDLMEPTGGTHGSIDEAVRGLGLDPGAMDDSGTLPPATEDPAEDHTYEDDVEVSEPQPNSTPDPSPYPESGPESGPETEAAPRLGPYAFALRVVAAIAAVIIAAVILGAVLGATLGHTSGPHAVPRLIGLSLEQGTVTSVVSSGVAPGPAGTPAASVLSQSM